LSVAKQIEKGLSINLEEFPESVLEVIRRHRYEAVRGISVCGFAIAMSVGLVNISFDRGAVESAIGVLPVSLAFLIAFFLNHHDRNARRSGLLLMILSAVAMISHTLFSAPGLVGHFLFFPAAAIGSVLLAGLWTGLIIAAATLGALYTVYLINLYVQPFPVLIQADQPASFVGAFLMTLVMIILAGRLLNDVQREYEASNRLLIAHLDTYRSLLSLLTNDLSASISNLKQASGEDNPHLVRESLKDIRKVIATARQLRGESSAVQQ